MIIAMVNIVDHTNVNKYPYLGKKEGSSDTWIFLEEDVSINVTNITAACGGNKDISAEEFVKRYSMICQMAISNKRYEKIFW